MEQLAGKTSEIESRTETLEQRGEFRPLDPGIRETVLTSLKEIAERLGPEIEINAQAGSANRRRVAEELAAILREAGFATSGPIIGALMADHNPLAPVTVVSHPEDQELARQLLEALGGFIVNGMERKSSGTLPMGQVRIALTEEPRFSVDGSVSFP
jgi:hypothetical protein